MTGLDTNVLVRYLAQDDPEQSPVATKLIESLSADSPGFISVVSVVELVWVLSGCYKSTRSEICTVLETLLHTKEIVVGHAEVVWQAWRVFKDGKADFADCLIERLANESGCDNTVTFDRKAVKYCGMQLISGHGLG